MIGPIDIAVLIAIAACAAPAFQYAKKRFEALGLTVQGEIEQKKHEQKLQAISRQEELAQMPTMLMRTRKLQDLMHEQQLSRQELLMKEEQQSLNKKLALMDTKEKPNAPERGIIEETCKKFGLNKFDYFSYLNEKGIKGDLESFNAWVASHVGGHVGEYQGEAERDFAQRMSRTVKRI